MTSLTCHQLINKEHGGVTAALLENHDRPNNQQLTDQQTNKQLDIRAHGGSYTFDNLTLSHDFDD